MKLLGERIQSTPPCPIGVDQLCCRNCLMGPCRLINTNGCCGASKELVIARNLLRVAAGGAAAHTGHALNVLNYLNKIFPKDYIEKKAPGYLQQLWKKLNIFPNHPQEEISQALHQTTMGVDSDWQHILLSCLKIGIVDGYYGLTLATELEDKILGKPKPKQSFMNLGVISETQTNIAVHGHDPLLPAKIVQHKGNTNVVGVCCTGAELLSRYGIPLAASFPFSEAVIQTGAIEAMVVDVQCIMPSLADLSSCFHTKLITTHDIARIPGAIHLPFNRNNADLQAKKIVNLAMQNRKNRGRVNIPKTKVPVWSGWTADNMPTKEIKEDLKTGKVKGVVAFVGCANPRVEIEPWIALAKRLTDNNYLLLATGCMGYELGKRGFLKEKGKVYHLGSCVNNSRVAEVFEKLAHGKLTDEQFLVSAPAPITEKAISIGLFFTALGVSSHFGYPFTLEDSKIHSFLKTAFKEQFNSKIFIEQNPSNLWKEIQKGV